MAVTITRRPSPVVRQRRRCGILAIRPYTWQRYRTRLSLALSRLGTRDVFERPGPARDGSDRQRFATGRCLLYTGRRCRVGVAYATLAQLGGEQPSASSASGSLRISLSTLLPRDYLQTASSKNRSNPDALRNDVLSMNRDLLRHG